MVVGHPDVSSLSSLFRFSVNVLDSSMYSRALDPAHIHAAPKLVPARQFPTQYYIETAKQLRGLQVYLARVGCPTCQIKETLKTGTRQ